MVGLQSRATGGAEEGEDEVGREGRREGRREDKGKEKTIVNHRGRPFFPLSPHPPFIITLSTHLSPSLPSVILLLLPPPPSPPPSPPPPPPPSASRFPPSPKQWRFKSVRFFSLPQPLPAAGSRRATFLLLRLKPRTYSTSCTRPVSREGGREGGREGKVAQQQNHNIPFIFNL